jgi:lactate racemase
MQSSLIMRSGAWYGDNLIKLEIPDNWDVTVLWPRTPPSLTEKEISEALQNSIGQPSIQFLCKGKKRPLIVVDDLNRPTPPEQVINFLLEYFTDAGIPMKDVCILMATGTHGKPAADAMNKKIGPKAAESCRLLIHDCFKNNEKIGKTSYGTKVYVDRAIIESDFVIGVGGIYPNYTAGFGGGSKLALGTLGLQSIFDLHFRHKSAGCGSMEVDTSLRKDLNEIANMIGLQTVISLQINADRKIVRVDCGDPQKYFQEALKFCNQTFKTQSFSDADVVISNTYPNDLSLTFARAKGFVPLANCGSNASRVAIVPCNEGLGLHNIFPFLNVPRFHKEKHLIRLIRSHGIIGLSKRASKYLRTEILGVSAVNTRHKKMVHHHPIMLYRPGIHNVELPHKIPEMVQESEWSNILKTIQTEQSGHKRLKVIVYPCAFLQFMN